MTPPLALRLHADEGALVIEALAELPFKAVFELIGRLNRQANAAGASGAGPAARYLVSAADLELIVAALGQLPYQRVYRLLAALREQLDSQPAACGQAAGIA